MKSLHESTVDFFELYEATIIPGETFKQAWQRTELAWAEMTGSRKYKNYAVFKVMKGRYQEYRYQERQDRKRHLFR